MDLFVTTRGLRAPKATYHLDRECSQLGKASEVVQAGRELELGPWPGPKGTGTGKRILRAGKDIGHLCRLCQRRQKETPYLPVPKRAQLSDQVFLPEEPMPVLLPKTRRCRSCRVSKPWRLMWNRRDDICTDCQMGMD